MGYQRAGRRFPAEPHDHRSCVSRAIGMAEALCAKRGVRLTPLRRRVFEIVWASHAPVGAYRILKRLSREHGSGAPPTVYRALDFLLEQGLVHRIESRNAYIGCQQPTTEHAGQFLICRDCGTAAEMHAPEVKAAIARGASALGFAVEAETVEVSGLCPACQAEPGSAGHDGA